MAVHGKLWDVFSRRGSKIALIIIGAVCGLGGLGVAGYHFWPEAVPTPPPPSATTEEASKFAASDDFNKLPIDQRIAWVDQRMQKIAEMSDEDRRKAWTEMDEQTRRRIGENMAEVMEERMNRNVDAYFKAPAEERAAVLDKQIDEMGRFMRMGRGAGSGRRGPGGPGGPGRADGARRPEGGGGRPPEAGGRPGGGRGPGGDFSVRGREGMVRLSKMPADKRARVVAYRTAMRKRMVERGFGGPGGPPR